MIQYLSIILCLIGLIVYLAADKSPKVQTIALHVFWVALLAFLLGVGKLL